MENNTCPNCGAYLENGYCKYCGYQNPSFKKGTLDKIKDSFQSTNNISSNKGEEEKGKFNVLLFVILLIFFMPAAFIYLFIYVIMRLANNGK